MAERPLRRRLVKMLGSLPLIADFMRRLGVERSVNAACPSRDNAHLTHGQVVLALLGNRLTQPRAMYHLLRWARQWAVGETFGFDAEHLNDDRLARCLDALAPQIDTVQGTILARAVAVFGLDLRQLHWDLTSVVLDGEFDPEKPPAEAPKGKHPYPQPGYGYGGVPDQKQLRVGELVSSDGLVPVFHRSFDGNQADVGTVVALMQTVRKHVSLPDCLVIGDSKLLSAKVLPQLREQHVHFLAPLPRTKELDAEFLSLAADGWQALDYVPREQAQRPPAERTQYLGQEVPWVWTHPESGAVETFRRLYVISSEERDTCRRARNQRLVQAAQELNALVERTGSAKASTRKATPGKPTPREKLLTRAQKLVARRKVGAFVQVSVRMVQGIPELQWELNPEAIGAAERCDGYYVLLSSGSATHADASALLRRWKQEWMVERRFHDWKGPLRVRPVFVTSPKRLAAFMLLLHLALLVFSLMEREARRALAARGQTKLPGMLAGHVAAVPTGANILIAFESWYLIVEEGPPRECEATELSAVPQNLWDLLGAKLPVWG